MTSQASKWHLMALNYLQKLNLNQKRPTLLTKQIDKSVLEDVGSVQLLPSCDNLPQQDEIISTRRGVFNQIILTTSVLITAAAAGMPIGYSVVILPQLYNTTDPLALDIEMGSWIASVHSAATPVGSFLSGPIMDRWGRRPALLLSMFPLLMGWMIIATANSHALLLVGRIMAGMAVGLMAAPAQIFIAECAEPRLRGILIAAPFVSYSFGILLVYALGSMLHWRHAAWAGTFLPVIAAIALYMAYETPVWLARNNKMDVAVKALSWLRGGHQYAKQEVQQLQERIENEKLMNDLNNNKKDSFIQLMKQRAVLKPMIIINGFHMLQILSGTYIVVFYAVDIISEFGGNDINAKSAAVLTALVRLVFASFYCYLLFVCPRRKMVITSGIICGSSALVFSIFMYIRFGQTRSTFDLYFSAICIILYIGSNTAFLAMPGCLVGELLPAKIRGQYAGYIFSLFNFAVFFVAKIFPLVHYRLRIHGLFLIFGIAAFGATALFYFLLPETKGKSLHEIEDYFAGKNWLWSNRKKITENKAKA